MVRIAMLMSLARAWLAKASNWLRRYSEFCSVKDGAPGR
jgi:hypothetical protein